MNRKRKYPRKPPTKAGRQLIKQIQALPPVDENRERAVVDKVVGRVLG